VYRPETTGQLVLSSRASRSFVVVSQLAR